MGLWEFEGILRRDEGLDVARSYKGLGGFRFREEGLGGKHGPGVWFKVYVSYCPHAVTLHSAQY